jgi:uncharacterized alpha-E superfamily protein
MLARIADSLFWIARYMERAEETSRILDVNYHMMLEQARQSWRLHWAPLIAIVGEQERFSASYDEANAQTVLEFLAFREDNPSSIVQCVAKARENARTIRERISREMWEDINSLYHQLRGIRAAEEIAVGPHRFCNVVKFGSHRFRGVTDATLPHDEGWQFLRAGYALERAETTARIVDIEYQYLIEGPADLAPPDHHQWTAILKSVGAFEAYRRQYLGRITPEGVGEMLILDAQHPRSIRFNMTELQSALRAISGTGAGAYANEAERLAGRVLEGLRYHRIHEIFTQGLHGYLTGVQAACRGIGVEIGRSYFYYTPVLT